VFDRTELGVGKNREPGVGSADVRKQNVFVFAPRSEGVRLGRS
jgi:hypothetical protein